MVDWETLDDEHPVVRDFAAIWQAAEQDRLLEELESALKRQDADRT